MDGKVTASNYTPPPGYRRFTAQSVHLPPTPWYRKIRIPGFTRRTSPYTNAVHTTKYTLFNFLPKNLWEQFHRGANLYFVFIIFLNLVPELEVFGKEIAFIPVLFVLLVTAVKDIFEDYRRYRSDKEVNYNPTRVYNRETRRFEGVHWKDVRLGDFVEIQCDAPIPADTLLLHSSDPSGVCYIETATLDGETNLKQRQAVLQTQQSTSTQHGSTFDPDTLQGEVLCEHPHDKIYEFNGYIDVPSEDRIPITRNNLLLRSCLLRNTVSVVGLVLYAGHETKAMMNNTGPRYKRSKLEKDINIDVVAQVVILIALCLAGAIGNGVWSDMQMDTNTPYFIQRLSPALSGFITFWSFIILLQVIVPISLYVSVEIVKFIQVYFINWDINMYHKQTNRPFQCRALNINEDLGQILYIFSDKTGTLTENEMVFRCCSIGGINYAHSVNFGLTDQSNETPDFPISLDTPLVKDRALSEALHDSTIRGGCLDDFFLNIALCNTVVVVSRRSAHKRLSENGGTDTAISPEDVVYDAESPDEAALVEAARAYGYILTAKSQHWATVHTPHSGPIRFEILKTLEFDSVRKCMSVVVREMGNNRLTLYSKGADSTIYRNLHCHKDGGTSAVEAITEQHLSMYSKLGLRTLCLAKKVITMEEYQDWLQSYKLAQLSREDKENLLLDSVRNIETQLVLLGATGIEDRLQDGVPETIEALRTAGVNVWVLTGDKQETAISIGYSSKLLSLDMDIVTLNATSQENCREMLTARKEEINQHTESPSSVQSSPGRSSLLSLNSLQRKPVNCNTTCNRALVLDGKTLEYILTDRAMQLTLLGMAKHCRSVLCCRVTPRQKAEVVKMVKDKLKVMTLAVGDGANDVSMIQAANVGVGIAGREGNQAVMASDFSMARFRFLERLLLVHGHWSYSRLANMMLYFFYKNVAYAVLLFWYQIFNGFSASTPIDGVNLIIFNLIYTSLPILVVAIGDQDLVAPTLLKVKRLYKQGQESSVYTRWRFCFTMVDALYESAAVFFVAYGAYSSTDVGVAEFGVVINFSIVITTSLHLAVETLHWTWVHHFALWGSIIVTFVFNLIYMAIDSKQNSIDTYWVLYMAASRPTYWFVLLLTPVVALLPRLVAKVIEQEWFPSDVLRGRAMERTPHSPALPVSSQGQH